MSAPHKAIEMATKTSRRFSEPKTKPIKTETHGSQVLTTSKKRKAVGSLDEADKEDGKRMRYTEPVEIKHEPMASGGRKGKVDDDMPDAEQGMKRARGLEGDMDGDDEEMVDANASEASQDRERRRLTRDEASKLAKDLQFAADSATPVLHPSLNDNRSERDRLCWLIENLWGKLPHELLPSKHFPRDGRAIRQSRDWPVVLLSCLYVFAKLTAEVEDAGTKAAGFIVRCGEKRCAGWLGGDLGVSRKGLSMKI